MRKVLTIGKREYLAAVKTKGFIIGLVLAPLLMGGGIIAMALLKDQVDTRDKRVAVVDRSGVMAAALLQAAQERNQREVYDKHTGRKLRPAYLLEVAKPNEQDAEDQRLTLSDQVRKGWWHAYLEIGPAVVHPSTNSAQARVTYHSKDPGLDELRRWIGDPINNQLRRVRLQAAGIDETKVKDLFDWRQVEGMGLASRDAKTGAVQKAKPKGELEAVGVPMAVMMLMWIIVMIGAAPLLQAVMEEKAHRIAEVMLGSVRPFEFMMGKLVGGVAVSLTGGVFYITCALIAVGALGAAGLVPYGLVPWFLAYMVLNVLMIGAIQVALGSLCNDPKDAQSLALPGLLPALLPMFMWFPVVQHPMSTFATLISLVPPFTPTLMLLRQSTAVGVPLWQPILGMLGVLGFTGACIWIGGRIFRMGLLLQGKPPGLRVLLRWAWRG